MKLLQTIAGFRYKNRRKITLCGYILNKPATILIKKLIIELHNYTNSFPLEENK